MSLYVAASAISAAPTESIAIAACQEYFMNYTDIIGKSATRLMNRAAHGPCPRNQENGAVTFYREISTYAFTQRDTSVLGKRHAVARRRCLTTKKWRPVIVKVLENRGDID